MTAAFTAPLALIALAGCALSSKAEPLALRTFSPEPAAVAAAPDRARPSPAAPSPATFDAPRLRLGQVTASAHLRYRIVHRDSPVAVDPYETLRWAEPPYDYVRRSAARALYDAGALVQAVGGAAPTLDVEVTAFEEVVRPGGHAGRVALRYRLHDERVVLARGEVAAERAAARPDIELVVAAIGQAMDAASSELAARVTDQLRALGARP